MNKIPKGQLVHYIFITKLTLASLVVGVINQAEANICMKR